MQNKVDDSCDSDVEIAPSHTIEAGHNRGVLDVIAATAEPFASATAGGSQEDEAGYSGAPLWPRHED